MDNHLFPLSSISFMLCVCCFIKFTVGFDDPAAAAAYLPDEVSITCGTNSVGTQNGRQWIGDTHPRLASSVQINGMSTISSVARGTVSVDQVPYKAARISSSRFSYVFHVGPGEKFIRLHFNPTSYRGFQKYKDLFNVEAGPFTLLSNFSASLTADALGQSSVIKEFCISVVENETLHIVFSPTTKDTYAFLNGIEISTVPLGHSYFHDGGDIGAQVVGRKSQWFYIDNNTVLEMVRRVDIKRDGYVSSGGYTSDMFGMLATASKDKANLINNITWRIPVDVGFRYLARLHFSGVGLVLMQETGSMNFQVLINEMIAYNSLDFVGGRNTTDIMTYKDYMVMLKGQKGVKHHLSVSMQLYGVSIIDANVLFPGFEILKLSNFHNSLSCPNPLPPSLDSPSSTVQILLSVLGHRNAIATISITVIAFVNIIVHKLGEVLEASCTEEEIKPSARAERCCRHFSLAEIKLATKNFNYDLILGKGGFGNVHKGMIDNGKEAVAVKRLKYNSSQGAHEFLMEIETLSEMRHINLVSLIGYCSEETEMILVYQYMAGGTLADQLYKLARKGTNCVSLPWKQRLNICIGAGRGLDYLHTGHGVIHRDVKTSNILLDENFTPKIADFGLVRRENLSNLESHVSTIVRGTHGYLDPSYSRTGKLTRKSDTYAFGVVLLEVLCGRPALDPTVSEAEQILTEWAQEKIRKGEVELIVDSNLIKEITPNSLKTFVEIAERCLDEEPKKRPTIAQVIAQLESSLEQQDILETSVPKEIMINAPCSNETNLYVGDQTRTMPSFDERTPYQTRTMPSFDERTPYQTRTMPSFDERTPYQTRTMPSFDERTPYQTRTMPSFDERTPEFQPEEEANNQVDYDYPFQITEGRMISSYKPSRNSPWDAIWKKLKPSRKFENPILSEISKLRLNLQNLEFDWSTIAFATSDFSSSNLIEHVEYGSVYRGMLPMSGRRVAVTDVSTIPDLDIRISLVIREILISRKVEHPNILKLRGYSIHKEKSVLVHEFVGNKSLYDILFGVFRQRLRWKQIFKIIMGVAQALAYLHDKGIEHGDLKTNNILIDFDMNPKISYFAKAIIELDSDLGITSRVCDTFLPSKTDEYSFGVVVLEIISGRRWISPVDDYPSIDSTEKLCLQDHKKMLDLVDGSIEPDKLTPVEEEEVLRSIRVGLSCVLGKVRWRLTMPLLVKRLEGE